VVVDEYLVGDNGILILIGTAMVAWWLGRRLMATRELNPYGRPKSVTSHTLP
jgi:hypothetical protein